MKKSYVSLIIIGLIIIIAVITNPNQDRHKEVLKNKLQASLQNYIKGDNQSDKEEDYNAGQAIGVMIGGFVIDKIVDNLVSTDNYVIASTTKITWNGEPRVVGIGVFGNVFYTSKFNDLLNEGLLNKNN